MDMLGDAVLDERLEIPISAIAHYSYCPRQCALIHVEQVYRRQPVSRSRGRLAHGRVDVAGDREGGVRVLRAPAALVREAASARQGDLVELRPARALTR